MVLCQQNNRPIQKFYSILTSVLCFVIKDFYILCVCKCMSFVVIYKPVKSAKSLLIHFLFMRVFWFSSDPCDSVVCSTLRPYSVCMINEAEEGMCVCPRNQCPKTRDSVCGTDGQSYDNECLMKEASCLKNVTVEQASKGPCGGNNEFVLYFY